MMRHLGRSFNLIYPLIIKLFLTSSTLDIRHLGVGLPVIYQSRSHPVRFRTVRTLEGSLFRVGFHVHLKCFISPKTFIAHRTGEFYFLGVNVDVVFPV